MKKEKWFSRLASCMLVCVRDAPNETMEGVLGDLLTDLGHQWAAGLKHHVPEVFSWVYVGPLYGINSIMPPQELPAYCSHMRLCIRRNLGPPAHGCNQVNCASVDLHWSTNTPGLLNDVAGSGIFSKAPPDHLTSAAGAQVPLAHLPILTVYVANATNQVLHFKFVSGCLVLNTSACCRSLCRSLAVLTLFLLAPLKGAHADPAERSGPAMDPSSSTGITSCLLESPLYPPDSAYVDVLSWRIGLLLQPL